MTSSHVDPEVSEAGERLERCLEACIDCHAVCLSTMDYCLEQGGEHVKPDHIRLLLDCADISQSCADFMLRSSEMAMDVCELCAEVCDKCAASCGQFQDDPEMQECAAACAECAQICRDLANQS